MTSPDHALMNVAARLAVSVGHAVTAGRRRGLGSVATKSTPTDMVTEWDAHGEHLITALLADVRPDDGILGEEGALTRSTSGITWIVDPIDGTTNFMYDIPVFAVSIAACDEIGPLAGAVYVPPSRELFVARRGGGAWLHGRRLQCNDGDSLDRALIATGFSYSSAERTKQIARLTTIVPQVRDLRRIGSAATDLCYVAAGRLDAYFEEHLQPWDYMAGMLIATEAGARCTDFTGDPVSRGRVLAAGPARHHLMQTFFTPQAGDIG